MKLIPLGPAAHLHKGEVAFRHPSAMEGSIDEATCRLTFEVLMVDIRPLLQNVVTFDTNEVSLFIVPHNDRQMERVAAEAAAVGNEWQMNKAVDGHIYRICLVRRLVVMHLLGALMSFELAQKLRGIKGPAAIIRVGKHFEVLEFTI